MESAAHVAVPLRAGGKKMKKRRELDALVAHSLAKRACNSGKRNIAGNGVTSQDQLLSQSTDEHEEYTWVPKVRSASRCRTKQISCLRTCGPFMLILCVFISFSFMYWLYFDLRQQITEYRMKIEQVSATSQNVPEALQKWHETSKNLEQNQTVLHNSIIEIHQILKNMSLDIMQLKEIDQNSKGNQLSVLQTNVADFGAKIRDFQNDIGKYKDQLINFQSEQKETKENFIKLNTTVYTSLNRTDFLQQPSSNLTSIELQNIKDDFNTQLLNLNKNLSSINYTLSQRTKGLEDDYLLQKSRLVKFSEDIANTSAIVTSIEDDWTQHKPIVVLFDQTIKNISAMIADMTNSTKYMDNVVRAVQTECQKIHQENSILFNDLNTLKQQSVKIEQPIVPISTKINSIPLTLQSLPTTTSTIASIIPTLSNNTTNTNNTISSKGDSSFPITLTEGGLN